ncbi:hypothetical protein D0T53_04280 [Dysgonomonas sp. 216]|uniref:Ig-like domain-containing protein n=1 Tax=Dysgonomonas sp. 216 TaxID=2302934 RepID=UPI0013CFAD89|nr:Ig-like domain-containing protein [Dysgonomonas sp. 216]NDW18134.1 hypothetical protein [Dysgonomonas sp. 216]
MIGSRFLISLRKFRIVFVVFVVLAITFSCANMASPGGGDYDWDPPKVIGSTPLQGAVNWQDRKIEIVFNELVKLESPLEKVIVTPPQQKTPIIQAINNKVKVEIRDTLILNTTYVIDFTDAVVDNNEGNVFENFAFTFSTGDRLDSLAISGKVLAANNLEPVKGMVVGLHSNLDDTAFTNMKFERISRTNERGEFIIRGVAAGNYRIYALDDTNRDYMYDNPGETIAFFDSILVPSHEQAFRTDTVYKEIRGNSKELEIDTILTIPYTRFTPDNIMLRSFNSGFKRQYLQKVERPNPDELKLFFGSATEMPRITPLNFEAGADWALLERNATNDTLQFWILDPEIIKMDTLTMQVAYYKTDSLNLPVMTVDTVNFMNRRKRTQEKDDKKKKDKDKEPEIEFFKQTIDIKSVANVYDAINIVFDKPVKDSLEGKIYLQRMKDSVYVNEEIGPIVQDSLNPRRYTIRHKWRPGDTYLLSADSASIFNYDGLWNNKIEVKFKVKNIEDYGKLYIKLQGLSTDTPTFVELLSKSDSPVRKAIVRNGGVGFANLNPGVYYARLIIDDNGNGKWDTGDYYTKRQPETVFYYNGFFDIKANWEITEDWDIRYLQPDKQKPLEITKNKPKDKDSKRKDRENREKQSRGQNNQSSSSSNLGGLSGGMQSVRR